MGQTEKKNLQDASLFFKQQMQINAFVRWALQKYSQGMSQDLTSVTKVEKKVKTDNGLTIIVYDELRFMSL